MQTPNWLLEAMNRIDVTDICLNGNEQAYADSGQGLRPWPSAERNDSLWSEAEFRSWVLTQLSLAGRSWDARNPFVDATLPSGHRLHVVFPPLSPLGILVSLRRLPRASAKDSASGPNRWSASPLYGILAQAVAQGESILISGATGSGKTTLVTDLLAGVPRHERIVALEDTQELAPAHPHFLSLISRPPNADGCGEVTLRTLLKQTLRMRPDRIILGECRGPEVLDLLQALNTGHRGVIATLHANSPRDALRRVELLCLLAAGGSIGPTAIRELLAVGVQWIAQVHRSGPQRSLTELWRIEGREGDTILMRPFRA